MTEHKLLSVTWIDCRWSSEIYSPEEFKEFAPATIETVGWGYEFENKVILASEYYPKTFDQIESYRRVFTIPKECIKKIKVYKELNTKKEKYEAGIPIS